MRMAVSSRDERFYRGVIVYIFLLPLAFRKRKAYVLRNLKKITQKLFRSSTEYPFDSTREQRDTSSPCRETGDF
jgi:hypothetical protein